MSVQVNSTGCTGFSTGNHSFTGAVNPGAITDPDTSNNQRNAFVNVTSLQRTTDTQGRAVTVRSNLDVPPRDGHTQAQIVVNQSLAIAADNSGPQNHRFPGQTGKNTVEAFVGLAPSEKGSWRFDFSSVRGFVPGSLRVEAGQVAGRDGTSVTFALASGGSHRVLFSFELDDNANARR